MWKDRKDSDGACYCPGGSPAAVERCSYDTSSTLLMGQSTYTIHAGFLGFMFSGFHLRGTGHSVVRVALHANSLVGFSPGQKISRWDKFSQSVDANQPTLESYGRQQSVSFRSGLSQFLNGGLITLTFSGGLTVITRFKMTGDYTTGILWEKIFDFGKGESNDNVLLSREAHTSDLVFQVNCNATEFVILEVG
jgi:hypothetical protein